MSTPKSSHGGARRDAGRKAGSGPYKEATVVRRIPESAVSELEVWLDALKQTTSLPPGSRLPRAHTAPAAVPLFKEGVRAGFPTPIQGYLDKSVDFNELLVSNSPATFIAVAEGDSMVDAGINDGDLLVVDRSVTPKSGHIVIAMVSAEFTVKLLKLAKDVATLHPANEKASYPILSMGNDDRIIGVVRWNLHKCMP